MTTKAQIAANRENAKKSTGPRSPDGKDVTKFNGLKHGLRAEQVVLPGEDRAAFEAETQAWFDDWKPASHTRAVLVERTAVASWKLRRATRVEAARLYETAADAAHEFDLSQRERVEGAPAPPADRAGRVRGPAALRPRRHRPAHRPLGSPGRGRLVGLDLPSGPPRPPAQPAGPPLRLRPEGPGGRPDVAPAARRPRPVRRRGAPRLLRRADRRASRGAVEVLGRRSGSAVTRSTWPAPRPRRRRNCIHRYEREHEKSLYAAIRGLLALEKSGADLPEEPEAPAKPEPEAVATPAGPDLRKNRTQTYEPSEIYVELASVGAATPSGASPVRSAGSPGRRVRPVGADPGPGTASKRR